MSAKRERREVRMKSAQDLAEQTRGFEPTAVKPPDGCVWYKMEVSGDKPTPVDFLPYMVGKGNPDCDEGWGYYRRKYIVHRIPTPRNPKGSPYCCEANFGRRCRICRWLEKAANAELAKSCKAKNRYLWLINPKPGTEPGTKDNPWTILDSNDWNKGMGFRELMQDVINTVEGGDEFFDLKKGMTAWLTIRQQPAFAGGSPYNAVTRVDLRQRKHQYSSSLLEKAPCLDDMLIDTPTEELDELIGVAEPDDNGKQGSAVDSDVDSTPEPKAADSDVDSDVDSTPEPSVVDSDVDSTPEPKASKNGKAPKFKVGTFVTWKKKEWEVKKVSSDGTSLTLEDEDGHLKHASPAECKAVPVADAGSDVDPSAVDSDVDSTPEPSAAGSDVDSDVEPSAVDSDVDSDVEPAPKKKTSKPAPKPAKKSRK